MRLPKNLSMRMLSLLVLFTFTLSGCSQDNSSTNNDNDSKTSTSSEADYFSDRDFETSYDESASAFISLEGDSASCSSNAVKISGSTITIIDEGTYILSGTLNNGMIIVDSEKTDKTQIVLNDANIHSETSAAIYILQSDKVFITTATGTINTLSNGGSFTAIDENDIDATIFSKEDLTLNGSGTLVVTSPGGHGIVSKDSLTITSGSYDINSASRGLSGKDDVCIAAGDFTIISGKDGIHAENADDSSLGYIYIQNGNFTITAEGDGIDANGTLEITDGFITVCGPTQGDTATLDYDISATISGGTFIGTGASSMAQTFSKSSQGVIAVKASHQTAGTTITLCDTDGNTILTHNPALDFAVVILSSPEIVSGETYLLTIGTLSNEITAN